MAHPESLADEILDRRDRYRALAADWNCGYLDLDDEWIDPDLLAGWDPAALARDGWLPLHYDDEGYVVVATALEPTAERVAEMAQAVGGPVCVAVSSDWDIEEALGRAFPPPAPAPRRRGSAPHREPATPRRPSARRWWAAGAVLAGLALALVLATGPTLVGLALLVCAGYLAGVAGAVLSRLAVDTAPAALTTVGPSLALLLTPPAYLLCAAALALPAERVLPAWALGVVLAAPLVGQVVLVYADLLDAFRRDAPAGPALLSPLRWLLDCAAAYRNLLPGEGDAWPSRRTQ